MNGEQPGAPAAATAGSTPPPCKSHGGAALERLIDDGLRPGVPGNVMEEHVVSDDPVDEVKSRYLSEVDIFCDLDESELQEIAERAPMRSFGRGSILFSPRQPVETLFILKTGSVRIFRIGPDGRAMTIALLGPGTIFGEMVLLGQHMYDLYAEAMDDAIVCLMDRAGVQTYLLGNPKIALRVTELLGRRLIEAERRLTDAVLKAAPQRVAATLHTMARKEYRRGTLSTELSVRLTHEQLADLAGTSRETVTKALGALAEEDIIKLGRGRIIILKPLELRDAAESAT